MSLISTKKTETFNYSVDVKIGYCTKEQRKRLIDQIKKSVLIDTVGAGPDGWCLADVIMKTVKLKKVKQEKKK